MMNIFTKSLLTLATTALLATTAYAEVNAYVGIKAGKYLLDADNSAIKDPVLYGIYGGYQFTPVFGIEGEYATSKAKKYTIGNANGEYKVHNYGVFATARYTFEQLPVQPYVKGKLGLSGVHFKNELSDAVASSSVKETKVQLGGAVAAGITPIKNVALELEYAYLHEDVEGLTLGLHYKF